MSEWIKWKGGECPISEGARVDIKFRDGGVSEHGHAGLRWDHIGLSGDIVAYRLSETHKESGALSEQIGGDHYKQFKIQPVEYIHANGLGFCQGNVIKYVTRYKDKGGVSDLEKAKHFIDLLIELEKREG
jgi:hypothetical protein